MSSIQTFLNTAMTIDQQEGTAEDNYNYEKAQLGEMYDEQKQQLLDSAATALPFGVAETSRAVAGLWQTGRAIQNFSAKYSPQIEAFKAKAASIYENIGKEGAAPTDYADLIKSAGTALGKKALDVAAPEVLKRTGIDLTKAVNASKGEGGLEAGLENLRSQGVVIAKTKAAGLIDEGITRVKASVAPIASQLNETLSPVGVERATNPSTRIETAPSTLEIKNPLFEGGEELTSHLNTIKNVASSATNEAVKAVASKTASAIDLFKSSSTELSGRIAETTGKLQAAQARVSQLQNAKFKGVEGGVEMYGMGRSGVTPGQRRPNIETNPDLVAAREEVATHIATLSNLSKEGEALKSGLASTLGNVRSTAVDVAKGVGGTALEGFGVYGGAQAIQSLVQNKGNVGGEQGTNDAAALYGGTRSAVSLGEKGVGLAKNTLGQVVKAGQEGIKVGENAIKSTAAEGVEKATTSAVESGLKVSAENVGKELAIGTAEKVGVGLAEEGATIGAAAAGASAIPIVGEAVDIGLGLYTAIDAIVNLFKSPPKPPPPPPVQQQVVAVQHQQGVY